MELLSLLSSILQLILKSISHNLNEIFNPLQLILFGSLHKEQLVEVVGHPFVLGDLVGGEEEVEIALVEEESIEEEDLDGDTGLEGVFPFGVGLDYLVHCVESLP